MTGQYDRHQSEANPGVDPSASAGAGSSGMFVDGQAFRDAFGEQLVDTLDVANWQPAGDLLALYSHLEGEVARAVEQESGHIAVIRRDVLPQIRTRPNAPDGAGVYNVTLTELQAVHRSLLFAGGVEACDGAVAAHETLALAITQVGVCLVSYQGDQGTWGHRLFQRELRQAAGSLEDLALAAIRNRQAGAADRSTANEQRLSNLARRGILSYAERAALIDRATAPWRMGHGNPIPYELLTGGGSMELAVKSAEMLERLLLGHRRFVFVASDPVERGLLTIGQALHPLEYVIFDTMQARLRDIVDRGHYTTREKRIVESFAMDAGPQIVMGIYRASEIAAPRIFYAHKDHAHEAALIALADSVLLEHRAFPMLLDLAEQVCRSVFSAHDLRASTHAAYADSGAPWRYLTDRETR